jgi:phosphoglycerate kinase
MAVRRVDSLDLGGKRVFLRADLDLPLSPSGHVLDDRRLRAALPTIEHILERGARLVLAAHHAAPGQSMLPVAEKLAEALGTGREVRLADDCVGDGVKKLVLDMREGELVMLENLRLCSGEAANDPEFARALASTCDAYVNDAFCASDRPHASTVGMVRHVPGPKGAGFQLHQELDVLSRVAHEPERPFVAVLGGGALSGKARLLEILLPRVDALLLGGALACTFLKARGARVGQSRVEEAKVELAEAMLEKASRLGVRVRLPLDHACAARKEDARRTLVEDIPADLAAFDIGPRTEKAFAEELAGARTVLWNGPLGAAEHERFASGTRAVARALAACPGLTVAVGDDTARAVLSAHLEGGIRHLSAAGEAGLAFLEGRELPGLKALE